MVTSIRRHHHQQQQQQQQQQQLYQQQRSQARKCTKKTINQQTSRLVIWCHLIMLLLNWVELTNGDWLMDCGNCHCKWNSGKKTADCKNLSLSTVPENLSSEVQVLDLSFNRITYLEQNAFLTADLQNLHKLFIRNSSLQHIDPRSFTQLEILIELDLSNNLLRILQANLFGRLVKVRALVLNGNLLETLTDGIFQNLKYLHKVELKDNRLVRIGTQTFMNVPLLSQIYLNGNRLSFLRRESFESLKRLTALSLDQNPWNCTCELQIFRDFVLKRNLYTPPTGCYYPAHLRGMLWVEDQPEAFACKPKIIYPARGASISTSKENVTLICRVHASPNTHIAWDYNKQLYRSSSASSSGGNTQRIHIQLLRDEQTKEKEFGRDLFISRLTILRAEKSDEGVYTCSAENAGGKDSVQMSLIVEKPGPRDLLLQGNVAIVISLMALGLLSVSVLLAMLTCCIYKRFKAINPGHTRHHHHHLDVTNQLTTGANHMATSLAGSTDVGMLGMKVDDTSGSNCKHHLQKTNVNGESCTGSKYAEVIKHGVTVMENGLVNITGGGDIVGGVVGVRIAGDGGLAAEKAYLERNTEDTLKIRYPHGIAKAEINRSTTSHDNIKQENKRHAETNGIGDLGGRVVEYQPDLLPSYNNSANNNQQGQLYSPIKATRTINLQEDQHQHQQQQQHQSQQKLRQQQPPPKCKFNSSTQEYLQSRYAPNANYSSSSISKPSDKLSKREASEFSLSAANYTSTAATTVTHESGFSTLQRHSKSLILPHRVSSTPTENSYEYRQPPPPPYNAAHRTTNSLLQQQQQQRRTSVNDDNDNNVNEDPGYRDGVANDFGNATPSLTTATRQTIVTASPSLNFLTTTGYTPRRHLL